MASNREISRLFSLYAELLLLHNQNERLAALLSSAAYRIGRMNEEISELNRKELSEQFRPEIIGIFDKLKKTGTIEALDELIQLTPQGLFKMMRIKGLGGKKLSILWRTAGIDSIDALLEACKKHRVSKFPGLVSEQRKISSSLLKYTGVAWSDFTMQVLLILPKPSYKLCKHYLKQSLSVCLGK